VIDMNSGLVVHSPKADHMAHNSSSLVHSEITLVGKLSTLFVM
jgi:hypothetical protein